MGACAAKIQPDQADQNTTTQKPVSKPQTTTPAVSTKKSGLIRGGVKSGYQEIKDDDDTDNKTDNDIDKSDNDIKDQAPAAPQVSSLPSGLSSKKSSFDESKFIGKQIVIVGAGPAGIHMATLLIKMGYKSSQIILLEKTNRCCGKSYTKADIDNFDTKSGNNYDGFHLVHEMGTCYLHPEYHVISELIKMYDPTNIEVDFCAGDVLGTSLNVDHEKKTDHHDDDNNKHKVKFSEWALNQVSDMVKDNDDIKTVIPKKYLDKFPQMLTAGITFEQAVNDYCKIHEDIFGKRTQTKKKIRGFPAQPSPENMKRIKCTMLDFLANNKLSPLIPFILYSQSMQGYGILDRIPAWYGLLWITPELLKTAANILRVAVDASNVIVLSKGYEHLWQQMVLKHKLNIIYNANITNVDRDLKNTGKKNKIKIRYKVDDKWFLRQYKKSRGLNDDNKDNDDDDDDDDNKDDNEIELVADILFLACGCKKALEFLTDVTDEEKEIFSGISPATLCATLFEYDVNPTLPTHSGPGDIWPNIIWKGNTQMYAYRHSLKAIIGVEKYNKLVEESKLKKDRGISYQYMTKAPEPDIDGPKFKQQLIADLEKWDEEGIKVIQQEVWDYFPKWTIDDVDKGYPWYVKDKLQGKYNNCFYIGASVCFESVLNVCEYNIELCNDYSFELPSDVFYCKKRISGHDLPFGEYAPVKMAMTI